MGTPALVFAERYARARSPVASRRRGPGIGCSWASRAVAPKEDRSSFSVGYRDGRAMGRGGRDGVVGVPAARREFDSGLL